MDEKRQKPHEETWKSGWSGAVRKFIVCTEIERPALAEFESEACARLAAQAPAMARLLLELRDRVARDPNQLGAGPLHSAMTAVLCDAGVLK